MTTPNVPLVDRLMAEAGALDALIRTCESKLHQAPIGCPHCKRDARQRDLFIAAVRTLTDAIAEGFLPITADLARAPDARLTDSESGKADGSAPDPSSTLTALQGSLDKILSRWRVGYGELGPKGHWRQTARDECADELSAALAVVRIPQRQDKKEG
jgi:hypothetical protein